MRLVLALHLVGALMWFGGLLSALRILIERTKEPPPVRDRFAYLAKGFVWFTALPGAILATATGAVLLTIKATIWDGAAVAKLALLSLTIAVHAALAVQERRLARRGAETGSAVFSIEHKVTLLVALGVLFASVARSS